MRRCEQEGGWDWVLEWYSNVKQFHSATKNLIPKSKEGLMFVITEHFEPKGVRFTVNAKHEDRRPKQTWKVFHPLRSINILLVLSRWQDYWEREDIYWRFQVFVILLEDTSSWYAVIFGEEKINGKHIFTMVLECYMCRAYYKSVRKSTEMKTDPAFFSRVLDKFCAECMVKG